jgi:hypothetical protein
MFDHFLKFNTEEEAIVTLPTYGNETENIWHWNENHVIPNQHVVLSRGVFDSNGNIETPEIKLPGYYMTISLGEINITLKDLPNNACRLIAERATGNLVYTAVDLNANLISTAIIEPVAAGSTYNFQG